MSIPLNITDTLKNSIYPEVDMQYWKGNTHYKLAFKTILRKEHKGKWYSCPHLQSHVIKDAFSEDDKMKLLSKFHFGVYLDLIAGAVNLELTSSDGESIIRKDKDQTPEIERLINLTKLPRRNEQSI
ncbi:MAG: hypothetical protein HRT72_03920 [Flavobacteriales bacterium]|nr:hypothetical protein [Flavobacteriales bacterium]